MIKYIKEIIAITILLISTILAGIGLIISINIHYIALSMIFIFLIITLIKLYIKMYKRSKVA
jgi:uncharacterized membrane protein YkvI